MREKLECIIFAIMGGGALLFAILGGAHLIVKFTQGTESSSWTEVSGLIEKVGIDRQTGANHRGSVYCPRIEYTYMVNGSKYVSNRLSFKQWCGPYSKAQNVVLGYPIGKTVKVFYNPSNPAMSVLEQGADLWLLIFFPLVLLIAAMGLLFLFVALGELTKRGNASYSACAPDERSS